MEKDQQRIDYQQAGPMSPQQNTEIQSPQATEFASLQMSQMQQQEFTRIVRDKTTLESISAMANTLIGSGCLILPMLFMNNGILTSIVFTALIGVITCKTNQIYNTHTKSYEQDIPEILNRIMGKSWDRLFNVSCGLLYTSAAMSYFLLNCNMMYNMFKFVFYHADYEYAQTDEINFSKFGYSWIVCLLAICFFLMANIKDLSILLKIEHYGFITILAFIIYTIFAAIKNVAEGNLGKDMEKYTDESRSDYEAPPNGDPDTVQTSLSWASPTCYNMLGIMGAFYACHGASVNIMAKHKNQQKNIIGVLGVYVSAFTIYVLIGVLGYLGIYGKLLPADVSEAGSVLDYFEDDDIAAAMIALLFFTNLFSVFPVLLFVSKKNLIRAFTGKDELSRIPNLIYIIIFIGMCFFLGLFDVNPGFILSIAGSIFAYNNIYFLPCTLHLACHYRNECFFSSFISYGKKQKIIASTAQLQPNKYLDDTLDDKEYFEVKKQESQDDNYCYHLHHMNHSMTKVQRYIIYNAIILWGTAILIFQIASFFM